MSNAKIEVGGPVITVKCNSWPELELEDGKLVLSAYADPTIFTDDQLDAIAEMEWEAIELRGSLAAVVDDHIFMHENQHTGKLAESQRAILAAIRSELQRMIETIDAVQYEPDYEDDDGH